ncbi:hypothetical protein EPYR_00149 [Erwinia pyrifoliae DSM 12163]|nr:hypothetical protein EPYR_00149 [Erwinia pyrifoliae DSM 12163]
MQENPASAGFFYGVYSANGGDAGYRITAPHRTMTDAESTDRHADA